MKRWPYIVMLAIIVGMIGYVLYTERNRLGLSFLSFTHDATENAVTIKQKAAAAATAVGVRWLTVDRLQDGFKVELPEDPQRTEVPAVNETGGTEPVKMLYAQPETDTTYAVTWSDNPPVARVNANQPERTLDHARDGMLARTETTLVSESRITTAGFPGREILAHNSSGGILNARLLFIPNGHGGRLYTLMALFPTAGARNLQDVNRFFNSFAPQPASAAAPTS